MTNGRIAAAALGAATLGLAGAALADTPTPPEAVDFTEDALVEAPLTAEPEDGYRGVQLFMAEDGPNCLGCHANYDTSATGRSGEVGPSLSVVGDRHAEAWFRALLVDSHRVFGEETAMPRFYVADEDTGDTILSAQEVEDLVAYLMELHAYGN